MAIYNEILVGRYNRALQKLLGMKGPASMNQLAGEMIPVIDTFYGTENRFLEGWDKFAIEIEQTAGAGNTAFCRLRNPVGSAVVAIIEKVEINLASSATPTADVVTEQLGAVTADLATITAVTRSAMDGRSPRLNSTCIASSTVAAGALNVLQKFQIPAVGKDLIAYEAQELTLLPGDAWQWQNTSVLLTLRVNLMWRERMMEESELK